MAAPAPGYRARLRRRRHRLRGHCPRHRLGCGRPHAQALPRPRRCSPSRATCAPRRRSTTPTRAPATRCRASSRRMPISSRNCRPRATMIFTGLRGERRARWAAALIALLDGFETMLSSDADIETLRTSDHRHLMRRLHALTADLAEDVRLLAMKSVTPAEDASLPGRSAQLTAIQRRDRAAGLPPRARRHHRLPRHRAQARADDGAAQAARRRARRPSRGARDPGRRSTWRRSSRPRARGSKSCARR